MASLATPNTGAATSSISDSKGIYYLNGTNYPLDAPKLTTKQWVTILKRLLKRWDECDNNNSTEPLRFQLEETPSMPFTGVLIDDIFDNAAEENNNQIEEKGGSREKSLDNRGGKVEAEAEKEDKGKYVCASPAASTDAHKFDTGSMLTMEEMMEELGTKEEATGSETKLPISPSSSECSATPPSATSAMSGTSTRATVGSLHATGKKAPAPAAMREKDTKRDSIPKHRYAPQVSLYIEPRDLVKQLPCAVRVRRIDVTSACIGAALHGWGKVWETFDHDWLYLQYDFVKVRATQGDMDKREKGKAKVENPKEGEGGSREKSG
ncbi:hypothetical protein MKZ38_005024 [Zalerion maritima]|uniref:Uncharacterized protein n=1 Tax=Zalerion maritima TaxID=339359 RepID=A0AAD5WQM8_9PEZI|nr:hypothetical protein MKZ38_005024 [Zalerion maritima]